jgi:hypothetical protein
LNLNNNKMDYIAYRIPQGEGHPNISGMEQLRYAENYYICSVIDINLISTGIIQKYGIVKSNAQVVNGLGFFIATSESAKIYKNYSSGQAQEFFDEEFNVVNGVRIKRPMTDEEVVDRYEAIRWVRKQMVKDYYKQKFETLTINKTPQERATWQAQLDEAIQIQNGDTTPTPTIDLLSTIKGVSRIELANGVITANENYKTQVTELFSEEETYITLLNNASGDDIINVRLPVSTTIIPGDTRFGS